MPVCIAWLTIGSGIFALLACHSYATSMTSVCLSVTLVDCDHIVQQKVETGTRQDWSVFWLCARQILPRL